MAMGNRLRNAALLSVALHMLLVWLLPSFQGLQTVSTTIPDPLTLTLITSTTDINAAPRAEPKPVPKKPAELRDTKKMSQMTQIDAKAQIHQLDSDAETEPTLAQTPNPPSMASQTVESEVVEVVEVIGEVGEAVGVKTAEYKENVLLELLFSAINRQKRYPYTAVRQQREGIVNLSFAIHPDGKVTDIEIVQSSRFAALDRAAVNAVESISPFVTAADYLETIHQYNVNIDFRLN